MENLLKSTRLIQRACWLVKLRWVAIVTLIVATFVASRFMSVSLPTTALYTISIVLVVYNFILYDLLRYWTWGGREPSATV